MFIIRSVCVCTVVAREGSGVYSQRGRRKHGGRKSEADSGYVIYSYKSGNVMNHPSLSFVIMSFVMTS